MEYSNDATLNQIAKEIFDKHKLHSYDSKFENIRFSKSGNIVIELADNQRFVFDDKYKMLNGSIIKKNIVYLREEELEFCQNIADSLLEEHKIKDYKYIKHLSCRLEHNQLVCEAIELKNNIFGNSDPLYVSAKKIKNFEPTLTSHIFFNTLSQEEILKANNKLEKHINKIKKAIQTYSDAFLSEILDKENFDLCKFARYGSCSDISYIRLKGSFRIYHSHIGGKYDIGKDIYISNEKSLMLILANIKSIHKIYMWVKDAEENENIVSKIETKTNLRENMVQVFVEFQYMNHKKKFGINLDEFVKKKKEYLSEIRKWKKTVLEKIKAEEKEIENVILRSNLHNSILAKSIVNLVLKNDYITQGMVAKLLKGSSVYYYKITKTDDCSKYQMLTLEEITDKIYELISNDILTTKDIKGTYGHYDILKPTKYSDAFLITEVRHKKMSEYSDVEILELLKEDTSKISLNSWKNRMFILDKGEILARYQDEVKKYFREAPAEIKEYIKLKASFESGYSKKRISNIVK